MSIEVERTFASDASTPAAVRVFLSEMLTLWGCADANETVCLLGNELATNAVVHAHTEITVRINLSGPRFLVEVEDGSPAMPQPLPLTPDSERGRGLFLIQSLSTRWGADRCSTGKIVWFEVPVGHMAARNARRHVAV